MKNIYIYELFLKDSNVDIETWDNYLKNIGLEFLEENYREIFKEEIYLEELLIDNNEVSE